MDLVTAAQGFSAMGSESRLEVLQSLVRAGDKGLLVGDIQQRTGIPGSTLAHHLKFLTSADLIVQNKQGRTIVNQANYQVENPGELPDRTTLHEEGAGEVSRTMLLESVSRHFLTWIDGWMNEGFKSVHENWLGRAMGSDQDVTVCHAGTTVSGRVTGMDEEGNLLFTPADNTVQAFALVDTVERHLPP